MRSHPLAVLLLFSTHILAQRVSFGVLAGTSATADFPTQYFEGNVIGTSALGSLIFGPSLDVRITGNTALVANALHRNLHWTDRRPNPDGSCACSSIGTWEFPILLRYRVPLQSVRPFVDFGPSFRTVTNKGISEPSNYGMTVGVGVAKTVGALDIYPTVRYTRWGNNAPFRLPNIRDQFEVLVGVSSAKNPLSRGELGEHKLWLGLVAGGSLTGAFPARGVYSSARSYITGLMAELELNRSWSVEMDGLYRPLPTSAAGRDPTLTWEVPVLAKYTAGGLRAKPYLAVGPSFRTWGNLNSVPPTPYGFTLATGVNWRVGKIRITPSIRYTRWAENTPDSRFAGGITERALPNQVEALIGLSF